VKEYDMSGFDTSQPITDEASLEEVDDTKKTVEPTESDAPSTPAEPDELGDATPGPR
jgi:hypothetical protein